MVRINLFGMPKASRMATGSFAGKVYSVLEPSGFGSKVTNCAWTQSVPPAVAGGYVVDAPDLLMFCKPDPLPTRYRRWY